MKRFLLALIGFFLIFPASFVQALDFNQAYQDYLYHYNQYRQAYKNYLLAKDQYLTYKTKKAEGVALTQTLDFLLKRNKVIHSYLTILQLRLEETKGLSKEEKEILNLKIKQEKEWYQHHQPRLASAASLEDLVKTNRETEKKYSQTEVLAYQILGAITAGKETVLREKIESQLKQIKKKIAEIRQSGQKDTTLVERWLLEADNKLLRSQEKEFLAQQKLSRLKDSTPNKLKVYNDALFIFGESHQYLKEANGYLKEIIREIRK